MFIINKTICYYAILFATFLFTFSFIPIVFEVIQQRITSNIPYISLICMILAFLIYLFIVINREYYLHILFYFIGLTSVCIIYFLKINYDKNNIRIEKTINEIIMMES